MPPTLRAALLTLSLPLAACVSSEPDPIPVVPVPPQTATVQAAATANTFTPTTVVIARGGTVTWTMSTRPHNVAFVATAGAPLNIPTMTNGQADRLFSAAGTFAYACTLHAGMIGTVVVQ